MRLGAAAVTLYILQQCVLTTYAFVVPSVSTKFTSRLSLSTAAAVNGSSSSSSSDSVSSLAEKVEEAKKNIKLTNCERARTVTSVCTSGTLCTVSTSEGIEGAPFGSYVDYVLDANGCPVFLMNEMSMHTNNIATAAAAAAVSDNNKQALVSLFTQLVGAGQDVSRCSVTGVMEAVTPKDPEWDAIRMKYALTHTYADQVMDSPKFGFYRLNPTKIFFVGGFGVVAEWVPVQDYLAANPDILASESRQIMQNVNKNHLEDLMLTANHLLGIENVEKIRVTSFDRLGFDVRVTNRISVRKVVTDEFRVGFRIPVISIEDAKSEVLKVFQEAWEKGQGYSWDDAVAGDAPGSTIPITKVAEDGLN